MTRTTAQQASVSITPGGEGKAPHWRKAFVLELKMELLRHLLQLVFKDYLLL